MGEEARSVKQDRGAVALFVSIVDVVKLKSFLMVIGKQELSLAKAAFPDATPLPDRPAVYSLGARVSRKLELIPPVSAAVAAGWRPGEDDAEPPPPPMPLMVECSGFGCTLRRCRTKEEALAAKTSNNMAARENNQSDSLVLAWASGKARSKSGNLGRPTPII